MWSIATQAFANSAGFRYGTQNMRHPMRALDVFEASAPSVATAS